MYQSTLANTALCNTITMWRFHLAAADILVKIGRQEEACNLIRQTRETISKQDELWAKAELERMACALCADREISTS